MTHTEARRALGAWGEDVAARHLVESGLVILERNWRCRSGEIDIVARDGQTLVICEVKTRSSERFGTPVSGVTPVKLRRLRRLSAAWLAEHDVRPAEVRLDVIGITRGDDDRIFLEHLRGVA